MQLRLKIAAIAIAVTFIFTFSRLNGPVTWHDQVEPTIPVNLSPPAGEGSKQDQVKPSGIHRPILTASYFEIPSSPQQTEPSSVKPSLPTPEQSTPPVVPAGDIPSSADAISPPTPSATCYQNWEQLQRLRQGPLSAGKRQFPYSRPAPECRTFRLPSLEQLIKRMKDVIKDPDLFRLFENSYPNTLDTMIKWRGYAKAIDSVTGNETTTDEELAYVITGDIDAMWLRDSASQIYSYLPLLEASTDPDSLASLWRGVINIHARYIIISPYCHSFQPPPESGVPPTHNGAYSQNHPNPPYDPIKVFDCKWELDSLASFLQISTAYYQRTNDLAFFQKYKWIDAVSAAVKAAGAMRLGTYSPEGKVEKSAWTFTGWTNRGSETLTNDGLGNPTKENGMVRSAFRPSDDACIYQLLVPANMMWAKYLEEASLIMEKLEGEEARSLTKEMRSFASGIRKAIDRDAVVHHRDFGDIWAYEIDGYGGSNLMDDANIPSLLSVPLFNYSRSSFPLPSTQEKGMERDYAEIYANTRRFVLNESNPYFMRGPVLEAVGGPHLGPGKPWPMAAIVRVMTAIITSRETRSHSSTENGKSGGMGKEIEEEVADQIRMVLDSTAGTGVVHESINAWNENQWTRAWFGWANGLFGELVLKLEEEDARLKDGKEGWLGRSWQ
jgi:meiotically up-regulated gene 157 (Mug157) protein